MEQGSYAAAHAGRMGEHRRRGDPVQSRLDAFEERLGDMGRLMRTFQSYAEACDASTRKDDFPARLSELEDLFQAHLVTSKPAANLATIKALTDRLTGLEQHLTEAQQENHYVHQHNAQVLLQLSNRLQTIQSQQQQEQQQLQLPAPASSEPAGMQQLRQQLADLQAQVKHCTDQLSSCSDASQHSQQVAVHTSSSLQRLEGVVMRSLADLRSSVSRGSTGGTGKALAAADIEAAVMRHLAPVQAQQAAVEASLSSTTASHAALAARLEALEAKRFVSLHDAQRLFQYVGIMTGIQGGLQTAVSQLQSAWPRVVQALAHAREDLCPQGPGDTAGRTSPSSRASGPGGEAATSMSQQQHQQQHQQQRHHHALSDVSAAHEVAVQAQVMVDIMVEQMGKAEAVARVAHEKFGGMPKLRQEADLAARAVPPSSQTGALSSSRIMVSSAGQHGRGPPDDSDLQAALREMSAVTLQMAERLSAVEATDAANPTTTKDQHTPWITSDTPALALPQRTTSPPRQSLDQGHSQQHLKGDNTRGSLHLAQRIASSLAAGSSAQAGASSSVEAAAGVQPLVSWPGGAAAHQQPARTMQESDGTRHSQGAADHEDVTRDGDQVHHPVASPGRPGARKQRAATHPQLKHMMQQLTGRGRSRPA